MNYVATNSIDYDEFYVDVRSKRQSSQGPTDSSFDNKYVNSASSQSNIITSLEKQIDSDDFLRRRVPEIVPTVPASTELTPSKNLRFELLGEWLGKVLSIDPVTKEAKIEFVRKDKKEKNSLISYVEFDEFSEEPKDIKYLVPGVYVLWFIGYQTVNGTKSKSSTYKIRRFPVWTKSRMDKAKKEADSFLDFLNNSGDQAKMIASPSEKSLKTYF